MIHHHLFLLLLFVIVHLLSTSLHRVGGQLIYTIEEETEIGHLVGNLLVDSQLDQRYSREVLRSFRFRFLSTPSVDFLAVDEASGNLLTTSRVDREAVCRNGPHHLNRIKRSQDARILRLDKSSQDKNNTDDGGACVVQVDVAVQPLEHFRVIRCSIRIQDINDNSPTFQPKQLVHELHESSQLGTGFVIPSAKDLDEGRFGIVGYMLEVEDPRDDKFGLKTLTKMDGSTEVRLILMKSLDKETKDAHTCKVLAYDGGNPQRNGTLEVTVVVVDCNDNAPIFELPIYEGRLTENSPLETVVLRILAHDADSGLNGEIVYGFAASTKSMYGNQFQVNPRSGEVKVIGSVDHEISHVCHLIVTATDRGNPPLQSEVPVKLTIDDVNDNRPSIVINTLFQANTDSANVTENAEPGTFVGHVIGSDADSGSNGRFNCSLTGGEAFYDQHSTSADGADHGWTSRRVEHFRLRRMFNGEYNIITSTPIDRERVGRGKNCRRSTSTEDEEDDSVCFQLNVVCQDHGTPSLRSDKLLQVTVADTNDNAPIFSKNVYRFEVFENSPVGFPFASVLATDADSGDNGRITYSLVPSNKAGSGKGLNPDGHGNRSSWDSVMTMFSIDSSTGELCAVKTVDHEAIKSAVLQVVANDNGKPKLSTVATVHLKILDVNDQPPVFAAGVFRFRLEENRPKNTEVGRVIAVDRDSPPYNKFRFQLSFSDGVSIEELYGNSQVERSNVSGNLRVVQKRFDFHGEPAFEIDPEYGIIRTLVSLDREATTQHVLVITALDSNDHRLSSTTTVLVIVDDVNDNPPQFIYPSTPTATFIHSEPLLKGRTFVSLSARDPDADNNGEVRYYINKVVEVLANNRQFPAENSRPTKTKFVQDGVHIPKTTTMTTTKTTTTTTTTTTTAVVNKTRRKESLLNFCEKQIGNDNFPGSQLFIIDPRIGRLTANEDFYIMTPKLPTDSKELLQNRTFAIEVLAKDCGYPKQLESKTTLNLVIVRKLNADLRAGSLESSLQSGNSLLFYGNIVLSEESLSWTLVLCVVTAFIVIILLTAITLVGCRGNDKTANASSVGMVRIRANSATTYTTDGFRTALLEKRNCQRTGNSEVHEARRTFESRFNCWKAVFRICSRLRRSA